MARVDRRRAGRGRDRATCRRDTPPAPSTLFDVPDAARGGASGADPVARPHRPHRRLLDARPGAGLRAARRHRADLHPSRARTSTKGICTSIWGAPTAESIGRKPTTPVVCINHPDGEALIAEVERGPVRAVDEDMAARGLDALPAAGRRDSRAERSRRVPARARPLRLLVRRASATTPPATPRCSSWRACCGALRDRLKRSVRIAWWPGHSTGRYAGSTWYADTFADEIDEHCIAQLDIDSPGCADATAYEEVMWMAEADALCRTSIQRRARPAVASACGRCAPATTRSTRSARPASTCCCRTSRSRSASGAATTRSAAAAATSPGTRRTT